MQVTGPNRDLHSGNDGGVFNEPLADLTKILASLVDSHNNIAVPGFYEAVKHSSIEQTLTRLEASDEFSIDSYKSALGITELTVCVAIPKHDDATTFTTAF